jgi:GMP synthase - Glutamine amidotransferase domain
MHIAFLDTNIDRSPFAARHPSEVDKFRALLEPVAPGWRYADFRVTEGHFPEAIAGYDGVMISGSPASVNDRTPWMERLEAVIREAVAADVPVFGACLGHQAVASALGGTVGRNPQGWVLGRVETAVHSPAPWMAGPVPALALHAAHNEQVTVLPPGASVQIGRASCRERV